jgi:tRNA-dihydrouridine synthase C
MEGVVDAVMREQLTAIGGYERCVTEFVRVSQTVLPKRVFFRYAPELRQGGLTPSGTPVYLQLLGSDPELMAANATRAATLGAPGIDLNFGCPAKTVNRSQGGAVLLRSPQLIRSICEQVRDSVPEHTPVTAKIRLGYDSDEQFEEILDALSGVALSEITIHARTKRQGYRPPAPTPTTWRWPCKAIQG